ncbi:MAG TPA: alpha/beta hydrolase [Dehalococcoidia bacterium]
MKLIFVHGAGNTGLAWHYQTKCFADSEAINLPGHPEGKLCTSIDQYVEWLHEYIRRKGYTKPVIAGHSMGGAIAQMYALSYPQEIGALVLIGTGARLRVHPDFLKILEDSIDGSDEWLRNVLEPPYSLVDPEVKQKIISGVMEVGVAMQLNDFRCCDKFDIMDKVNQITMPALVICGSADEMTPLKYAQYLADKITGSRLVVVEGGTHLCHVEKPAEVNQAIEEFLANL